MSNMLSVRRVRIQTLDEQGRPEGKPSYGVLAADDYAQTYIDVFRTFEELNQAIEEEAARGGCLLDVAGPGDLFGHYDPKAIGTDNYFGGDWDRDLLQ